MNLKYLYMDAKAHMNDESKRQSYLEAVKSLLDDPALFAANSEFIFKSNEAVDIIEPYIESITFCIKDIDKMLYEISPISEQVDFVYDIKNYLESEFESRKNSLLIFSSYISESDVESYIKDFYAVVNRKMKPVTFYRNYSEAAIPDLTYLDINNKIKFDIVSNADKLLNTKTVVGFEKAILYSKLTEDVAIRDGLVSKYRKKPEALNFIYNITEAVNIPKQIKQSADNIKILLENGDYIGAQKEATISEQDKGIIDMYKAIDGIYVEGSYNILNRDVFAEEYNYDKLFSSLETVDGVFIERAYRYSGKVPSYMRNTHDMGKKGYDSDDAIDDIDDKDSKVDIDIKDDKKDEPEWINDPKGADDPAPVKDDKSNDTWDNKTQDELVKDINKDAGHTIINNYNYSNSFNKKQQSKKTNVTNTNSNNKDSHDIEIKNSDFSKNKKTSNSKLFDDEDDIFDDDMDEKEFDKLLDKEDDIESEEKKDGGVEDEDEDISDDETDDEKMARVRAGKSKKDKALKETIDLLESDLSDEAFMEALFKKKKKKSDKDSESIDLENIDKEQSNLQNIDDRNPNKGKSAAEQIRNKALDANAKDQAKLQNMKKNIADAKGAANSILKTPSQVINAIKNFISDQKEVKNNAIKEGFIKGQKPPAWVKACDLLKSLLKTTVPFALFGPFFGFLWNIVATPFRIGGNIKNGLPGFKKYPKLKKELAYELKAELDIVNDKIDQAEKEGDYKEKRKMMRVKNTMEQEYVKIIGHDSNLNSDKNL